MRPFPINLRMVALVFWATALACFSLAPGVPTPAGVKLWDKFSHFTAYAVLAVLLVRVPDSRHPLTLSQLSNAWLGCASYGLLLECLQWSMALGRRFEPGDLLANGLGALLGCVVFCRKVRR